MAMSSPEDGPKARCRRRDVPRGLPLEPEHAEGPERAVKPVPQPLARVDLVGLLDPARRGPPWGGPSGPGLPELGQSALDLPGRGPLGLDLPRLDLPRLDLPRLDLPRLGPSGPGPSGLSPPSFGQPALGSQGLGPSGLDPSAELRWAHPQGSARLCPPQRGRAELGWPELGWPGMCWRPAQPRSVRAAPTARPCRPLPRPARRWPPVARQATLPDSEGSPRRAHRIASWHYP